MSEKPRKPAKKRTPAPARADAAARESKVAELLCTGEYTAAEIAEATGIRLRIVQRISAKLRPQIVRTKEQAIEDAMKRLRRGASRAAEVLFEQLDHADPEVCQKAAKTLLDRIGAHPTQGREHKGDLMDRLHQLVAQRLAARRAQHVEDPTRDHAAAVGSGVAMDEALEQSAREDDDGAATAGDDDERE